MEPRKEKAEVGTSPKSMESFQSTLVGGGVLTEVLLAEEGQSK